MENSIDKWKQGRVATGAVDKHGNELHQFDYVKVEGDEDYYANVPLLVMWSGVAEEYVAMNLDGGWISQDTLHITEKIFDLIPYMKVFRMNDCDYVAAISEESAMEWYMEETKLPSKEAFDDPKEVSLNGWMWYEYNDLPESEKEQQFAYEWDQEMKCVKKTFAEVIKLEGKTEPYIICSMEY